MTRKAIVKNISLLTLVLTILFMVLVVIYQITASHRDLADDLNNSFAKMK